MHRTDPPNTAGPDGAGLAEPPEDLVRGLCQAAMEGLNGALDTVGLDLPEDDRVHLRAGIMLFVSGVASATVGVLKQANARATRYTAALQLPADLVRPGWRVFGPDGWCNVTATHPCTEHAGCLVVESATYATGAEHIVRAGLLPVRIPAYRLGQDQAGPEGDPAPAAYPCGRPAAVRVEGYAAVGGRAHGSLDRSVYACAAHAAAAAAEVVAAGLTPNAGPDTAVSYRRRCGDTFDYNTADPIGLRTRQPDELAVVPAVGRPGAGHR